MAQRSGLIHNTVSRGRRAFGLQPSVAPPGDITETFKLSANPSSSQIQGVEKVRTQRGFTSTRPNGHP